MTNDHFIPRVLTRPWEHGDRRLRVFDLESGRFSNPSSRRLFAKANLNSKDVEKWLGRVVEQPIAHYVRKLESDSHLRWPQDWRTSRALVLLMFLNTARILEAREEMSLPMTMEKLSHLPDAALDDLARLLARRTKRIWLHSVSNAELFFTEVGIFTFPVPGCPVLAMPITPHHAVLAYSGPLSVDQLSELLQPELISAYSVGVGSKTKHIILPPTWREASDRDENDVRARIRQIREGAIGGFNAVGELSARVGFEPWGVG